MAHTLVEANRDLWLPVPKRSSGVVGNRSTRRAVYGSYDAAQYSDADRRHWAASDGLSANAVASPQARQVIRNRARYEVANNGYADGIVQTLASDTIGTGPRVQFTKMARSVATPLEAAFQDWADAVRLAELLRVAREAKAVSGEVFVQLTTNPRIDHDVKLFPQLIEADQVATPDLQYDTRGELIDGIVFDEFGCPLAYHVLETHPGAAMAVGSMKYRVVQAPFMMHYAARRRPGQARGVSQLMSSLRLFGQLRRYSLAVLSAAETAASWAAVLESESDGDDSADMPEPMDTIETEPNMMVTLPAGMKANQLKAEQPITTYKEYVHQQLAEAVRPLSMPANIARCDSSGYNYSSGRLDHQTYYRSLNVERSAIVRDLLDPIVNAWMREAALVGIAPAMALVSKVTRVYMWDAHEHVDPLKEATAQATRLASRTTSYRTEFARRGEDWETELTQIADEQQFMARLGLGAPPGNAAPMEREPDDEEVAV